MPIRAVCPACQKPISAKDTLAGKRVKCLECGGIVTLPDRDVDDEQTASSEGAPRDGRKKWKSDSRKKKERQAADKRIWIMVGAGGGAAALALIVLLFFLLRRGSSNDEPETGNPIKTPAKTGPSDSHQLLAGLKGLSHEPNEKRFEIYSTIRERSLKEVAAAVGDALKDSDPKYRAEIAYLYLDRMSFNRKMTEEEREAARKHAVPEVRWLAFFHSMAAFRPYDSVSKQLNVYKKDARDSSRKVLDKVATAEKQKPVLNLLLEAAHDKTTWYGEVQVVEGGGGGNGFVFGKTKEGALVTGKLAKGPGKIGPKIGISLVPLQERAIEFLGPHRFRKGFLANDEAVTTFIELLKDPDPVIRRLVLGRLEYHGLNQARKAVPAIRECLNDPDENVRSAASRALEKIK